MARRQADDNTHGKHEHEPQPPPPRTNTLAVVIRALNPRFCVSQCTLQLLIDAGANECRPLGA